MLSIKVKHWFYQEEYNHEKDTQEEFIIFFHNYNILLSIIESSCKIEPCQHAAQQ